MPINESKTRIVDDRRVLDYDATSMFFSSRAEHAAQHPLTATMYQDESLALMRDREEKARVLPLLSFTPYDRVLDLGCGTGRWAEALADTVDAYLGIDFSDGLLDVARQRVPRGTFQSMNVARIEGAALEIAPPFSAVICSGILIYINDDDIRSMFRAISHLAAASSRIYLREPMAKDRRLTLDRHWSDELKDRYSAIYRTREEYLDLCRELQGFKLVREGSPFSDALQNRAETSQRYMILERVSA